MLKKTVPLALILVIGMIGGLLYWWWGRTHVKTHNAYVNAHVVEVAPQITDLVAPGRNKALITAKQHLFALMDTRDFWVEANFKDTELKSIRPGQKATIRFDIYPKHKFRGVVESTSNRGAVFSLPTQKNSNDNWAKADQRIPVQIRVLDLNPKCPLKMGISANVSIDIS